MIHIFQVGVGSGGIVVLDAIARDPRIARITLVEPDVYQPHNVHRHLFPLSAVGRMKAEYAVEWIKERRPDVLVEALVADLTDPGMMPTFAKLAAECDLGVCAVDNEAAKFAFDSLMRNAGKPWTLGEVLSGGIGGWVHRFTPDGPCYGCVASHLKRNVAEEPSTPPDYANPGAAIDATTIPASKASIGVIANVHAAITMEMIGNPSEPPPSLLGKEARGLGSGDPSPSPSPKRGGEQEGSHEPPPSLLGKGAGGLGSSFISLLFTLARVPGVFDDAFRTYRFRIAKSAACLICSSVPAPAGEDLDVALDQALARLAHE